MKPAAEQHQTQRPPLDRGKHSGRRSWLDSDVSPQERAALIQASQGTSLGILLAAAVLHFQSLDREQQVDAVLQREKSFSPAEALARDNWAVAVWPEISAIARAWRFPVFKQSQVMASAACAFLHLPIEDRESWLREVCIFIGDPRHDPRSPEAA
jgi:hypothetical protein